MAKETRFELAVSFDGVTWVSSHRARHADASGPGLRIVGGGGGGGAWDLRWWRWPLPQDEQLFFLTGCPALDVRKAEASLPASMFVEAAARAQGFPDS